MLVIIVHRKRNEKDTKLVTVSDRDFETEFHRFKLFRRERRCKFTRRPRRRARDLRHLRPRFSDLVAWRVDVIHRVRSGPNEARGLRGEAVHAALPRVPPCTARTRGERGGPRPTAATLFGQIRVEQQRSRLRSWENSPGRRHPLAD